MIARKANISSGHQQVNNVLVEPKGADLQNMPNQLSGVVDELYQDARTQGTQG